MKSSVQVSMNSSGGRWSLLILCERWFVTRLPASSPQSSISQQRWTCWRHKPTWRGFVSDNSTTIGSAIHRRNLFIFPKQNKRTKSFIYYIYIYIYYPNQIKHDHKRISLKRDYRRTVLCNHGRLCVRCWRVHEVDRRAVIRWHSLLTRCSQITAFFEFSPIFARCTEIGLFSRIHFDRRRNMAQGCSYRAHIDLRDWHFKLLLLQRW